MATTLRDWWDEENKDEIEGLTRPSNTSQAVPGTGSDLLNQNQDTQSSVTPATSVSDNAPPPVAPVRPLANAPEPTPSPEPTPEPETTVPSFLENTAAGQQQELGQTLNDWWQQDTTPAPTAQPQAPPAPVQPTAQPPAPEPPPVQQPVQPPAPVQQQADAALPTPAQWSPNTEPMDHSVWWEQWQQEKLAPKPTHDEAGNRTSYATPGPGTGMSQAEWWAGIEAPETDFTPQGGYHIAYALDEGGNRSDLPMMYIPGEGWTHHVRLNAPAGSSSSPVWREGDKAYAQMYDGRIIEIDPARVRPSDTIDAVGGYLNVPTIDYRANETEQMGWGNDGFTFGWDHPLNSYDPAVRKAAQEEWWRRDALRHREASQTDHYWQSPAGEWERQYNSTVGATGFPNEAQRQAAHDEFIQQYGPQPEYDPSTWQPDPVYEANYQATVDNLNSPSVNADQTRGYFDDEALEYLRSIWGPNYQTNETIPNAVGTLDEQMEIMRNGGYPEGFLDQLWADLLAGRETTGIFGDPVGGVPDRPPPSPGTDNPDRPSGPDSGIDRPGEPGYTGLPNFPDPTGNPPSLPDWLGGEDGPLYTPAPMPEFGGSTVPPPPPMPEGPGAAPDFTAAATAAPLSGLYPDLETFAREWMQNYNPYATGIVEATRAAGDARRQALIEDESRRIAEWGSSRGLVGSSIEGDLQTRLSDAVRRDMLDEEARLQTALADYEVAGRRGAFDAGLGLTDLQQRDSIQRAELALEAAIAGDRSALDRARIELDRWKAEDDALLSREEIAQRDREIQMEAYRIQEDFRLRGIELDTDTAIAYAELAVRKQGLDQDQERQRILSGLAILEYLDNYGGELDPDLFESIFGFRPPGTGETRTETRATGGASFPTDPIPGDVHQAPDGKRYTYGSDGKWTWRPGD